VAANAHPLPPPFSKLRQRSRLRLRESALDILYGGVVVAVVQVYLLRPDAARAAADFTAAAVLPQATAATATNTAAAASTAAAAAAAAGRANTSSNSTSVAAAGSGRSPYLVDVKRGAVIDSLAFRRLYEELWAALCEGAAA